MPEYKYFIGIDASLNTLDLCALDTEEKIITEKRFSQTKEEFNKILEYLQTIGNPQDLAIGIESTGSYHINILTFLISKDYHITLLNPLLVKNFKRGSTLRKTTTDKISAKTIATFLLKNPDKIKNYTATDSTKLLGREHEIIAQEIAKLKNRIKQITFNIFNELTSRYNILTKTMLEFLLTVPSARIARELGQEKITEIIKEISRGKGRKVKLTTAEIMGIAYNTISIDDDNREEILKSCIKRLLKLEEELDTIKPKFIEKVNTHHQEPMNILTSVPGIGNLSAANFIAEMPTIDTITSHKKIIAGTGIDPIIQESGKFKGQYRISKRGNRHLRRTIWQMTMGTIWYTHTFRIYYERKRKQGMKHKKAVIATANKLLRVLYILLTRKITFSDIHHSNLPPIPAPILHS